MNLFVCQKSCRGNMYTKLNTDSLVNFKILMILLQYYFMQQFRAIIIQIKASDYA